MDHEKPYELKKESGEIFLRVLDADTNPHIILESLADKGIAVSFEKVKGAIAGASGQWTLITGKGDKKIQVRISPDHMKAEIFLDFSESDGMPGMDEIRKALEENGVIEGLDEELLNKIPEKGAALSWKWIEIARGKPSRDGIDASLNVLVDTGRNTPLNSDDAVQVDLKNLGIINSIREKQLIAVKTPLQEGLDGMDVTGKSVKSRKAKDITIKAGPNTSLSEDGLELTATAGGHLLRDGNRFSVETVFQVRGDIDYGTGNLECFGSIIVSGSVRDHFSLKAHENIEIMGVVEGAYLSAGKDMTLRSSVRGMGSGFIECGNDLNAEYMDQCRIKTGRNLFFKKALMHCEVEAEGAIRLVEGGKGLIAGGILRAGLEIECTSLGSRIGTKTSLLVGISPKLIAQKKDLLNKKLDLMAKVKTLEKNIFYLSKTLKERGLNDNQKTLATRFLELRPVLQEQLARIEALQQEIDQTIDRAKLQGTVKVRGICYPGVAVSIRQDTLLLRETLEEVQFVYQNGRVKIVSLKE